MCFVDSMLEDASLRRHQQMLDAYTTARTEAQLAVGLLAATLRAVCAVWEETKSKSYLSAADFVCKSATVFVDQHVSALIGEAKRLRDQAAEMHRRSLEVLAGSADAEFQEKIRDELSIQAADTPEQIGMGNLGQLVRHAVDKSVAAGQIAVDIARGKPPAQAVVSNVTGSAAGGFAVEVAGEPLAARGRRDHGRGDLGRWNRGGGRHRDRAIGRRCLQGSGVAGRQGQGRPGCPGAVRRWQEDGE
jgi:hypothetical protein